METAFHCPRNMTSISRRQAASKNFGLSGETEPETLLTNFSISMETLRKWCRSKSLEYPSKMDRRPLVGFPVRDKPVLLASCPSLVLHEEERLIREILRFHPAVY